VPSKKYFKNFSPEGPCENVSSGPAVALDDPGFVSRPGHYQVVTRPT